MSEQIVPDIQYRPPKPENPEKIGIVGCGGIAEIHLSAYEEAGWDVVAFCDIDESAARDRRNEFNPDGDVYTDHEEMLERADINVVDAATHPEIRPPIVEDAIRAGKHVLSQKPFVLDIDKGEELVELADEHGVKFAVNQNGRWAPHWSWIRYAVNEGYVGDVRGAHLDCHWNHDWMPGTSFDDIRHTILYDYAIHWFDVLACIMDGQEPGQVFASVARSPGQEATPPLLGQALVEYDDAQASVTFDGHVEWKVPNRGFRGRFDRTYVGGTEGTLRSEGPNLNDQTVSLHSNGGSVNPNLEGTWFTEGFQGTMGELLSAVEEDREPENSARDNIRSLELCYAAVASAEDDEPKVPGEVRELRQGDPATLAPR